MKSWRVCLKAFEKFFRAARFWVDFLKELESSGFEKKTKSV